MVGVFTYRFFAVFLVTLSEIARLVWSGLACGLREGERWRGEMKRRDEGGEMEGRVKEKKMKKRENAVSGLVQ